MGSDNNNDDDDYAGADGNISEKDEIENEGDMENSCEDSGHPLPGCVRAFTKNDVDHARIMVSLGEIQKAVCGNGKEPMLIRLDRLEKHREHLERQEQGRTHTGRIILGAIVTFALAETGLLIAWMLRVNKVLP
jgi:hypothetical protein